MVASKGVWRSGSHTDRGRPLCEVGVLRAGRKLTLLALILALGGSSLSQLLSDVCRQGQPTGELACMQKPRQQPGIRPGR